MIKHFRKTILAVASATFLLFLTACASAPTEGVILTKDFTPAYDETYEVPVDTYDYGCRYVTRYDYEGNSSNEYECGYYHGDHGATETKVRHHPDKWSITFEGANSDGEMKKRTVNVSELKFNEAKAGYYITVEDDVIIITAR